MLFSQVNPPVYKKHADNWLGDNPLYRLTMPPSVFCNLKSITERNRCHKPRQPQNRDVSLKLTDSSGFLNRKIHVEWNTQHSFIVPNP